MPPIIRKAFTLIELLVVIAIIGILSGLIVVSMSGVTEKANFAKAQAFSNSLRNSLMLNIIGEWKFDELSTATEGAAISDSWGGVNSGILDTYVSTVDPVTNKIKTGADCVSGSCLSFDGTNDYVYVDNSESASSNLAITGAITLSAWVKYNNVGTNGAIIGRGSYSSNNGDYGYGLRRYSGTNKIYWYTHSTTTGDELATVKVFDDSNWHYIVATWDGTINTANKKIYVDGALNNYRTGTIAVMGTPSYEFRIGMDGADGHALYGLIDEARVYNVAMPTSQVKEEYYIGLNKMLNSGSINKEEYLARINNLISKNELN